MSKPVNSTKQAKYQEEVEKAEKAVEKQVEKAGSTLRRILWIMHRCLACVVLVLLVGVVTYIAVYKLGVPPNKLQLAAIPAAVLGTLTVLFIWLNRDCWVKVESKARPEHFAFWLIIVGAFIYAAYKNDLDLMIFVYLFGFGLPVVLINLVKGQCKPIDYSLLLGVHGGIGAYAMVLLVLWLLQYANIPFTVVTATIAGLAALVGALAARGVTPSLALLGVFAAVYTAAPLLGIEPPRLDMTLSGLVHPTGTIIPYHVLASFVAALFPPWIVLLWASFVEETMFRLPLALFKRYGMYFVGFIVSFFFIYLHIFGYIELEPSTLLQVLTCIACANAMFVAVYTRTLRLWSSVVAHLLYNVQVLAQVPLLVSLVMLMLDGILHILLVRLGILRNE